MKVNDFSEILMEDPIIAGIKDDEGLQSVIKSNRKVVFVLYGDILNITEIVQKLKLNNKIVFVNVDLIDGFSQKEIVVQYLKKYSQLDGILSAKVSMIKIAKSEGLLAIHRSFLIDSFAFHNLDKQVDNSHPDFIEVLPGCIPTVISWIIEKITIPIIAGGLVCTKEDVIAALSAGAFAISSTNPEVWNM